MHIKKSHGKGKEGNECKMGNSEESGDRINKRKVIFYGCNSEDSVHVQRRDTGVNGLHGETEMP